MLANERQPFFPRTLSLLAILATNTAQGGTWEYHGSYELDYTSNAFLTVDNEESDIYQQLNAGISYHEQSTRLEADISTSVEYRNYQDNSFDDDTWLYIDADARWAIVRNRLFWVLTDSLSNEPIDERAPRDLPNNIQQTNVFSTGPSLVYEFHNKNRLNGDLRYMNSWSEETKEFNSDRLFAGLNWAYEIAAATDIGIGFSYVDVTFDDTSAEESNDYQKASLFGTWDRRLGEDSVLRIEAGATYVELENQQENTWHGLVDWRRTISRNSSVEAIFRHGLLDESESLIDTADSGGFSIIGPETYELSELSLHYALNLTHSFWGVSASYETRDYVNDTGSDRDLFYLVLGWNQVLGRGWHSNVDIEFSREEYDIDGLKNNTLEILGGIEYQSTRHMTYRLAISWDQRNSNQVTEEYEDIGFNVMLLYRR